MSENEISKNVTAEFEKALRAWRRQNPLFIWRSHYRFSLRKVADLLGVSRQIVNNWEKGDVNPRSDNFDKLAKLIKVSKEQWDEWQGLRPIFIDTSGAAETLIREEDLHA